MPIGIWNLEWLNHNSQRSYPLAEDATKTDITGTFTLPDDFILGLYFPIHAGLDVDVENGSSSARSRSSRPATTSPSAMTTAAPARRSSPRRSSASPPTSQHVLRPARRRRVRRLGGQDRHRHPGLDQPPADRPVLLRLPGRQARQRLRPADDPRHPVDPCPEQRRAERPDDRPRHPGGRQQLPDHAASQVPGPAGPRSPSTPSTALA